jgi:FlaA1/EpsC-like NDP-sugar epimerase
VRPGEKLYEEMFFTAENVLPTDHPKVLRARNGLLADGMVKRIELLTRATEAGRPEDEIRKLLQTLVPDFHPHGTSSMHDDEPRAESAKRA